MKALKFTLSMLVISLMAGLSGVDGHNLPLEKEPFRMVQLIHKGMDYHEDGGNYTLFPAYSIFSIDGDSILNVPEGINKPHTILIIPGEYFIALSVNGDDKEFHIVVDEDCFQQIHLRE